MLRDRIRDLMPQARADLAEMVTFRSVHDAAQFPVSGCDAMVDWLVDAFTTAGLSDVQAHVTADGSKAVTGVRPGPPGSRTVLLYFHHDVQPPLDDAAWHSSPWELVEPGRPLVRPRHGGRQGQHRRRTDRPARAR